MKCGGFDAEDSMRGFDAEDSMRGNSIQEIKKIIFNFFPPFFKHKKAKIYIFLTFKTNTIKSKY